MKIEDFIARLDGVRAMEPGKWQARCPSHDDRVGSLVVTDSPDRILACCHAGCGIGKILLALGLDWRDLFHVERVERPGGVVNIGDVKPAQAAATKSERPAGGTESQVKMPPDHIVQGWERALTGPLLGRLRELKGWSEGTLRKIHAGWDEQRVTFPVYGPDGWMVGLVRYLPGGQPKTLAVGPRELWPAPEHLPDGDVWLVEGEPDRVSAVEIGLLAVAVPGVATWKPGWAERFRGRRVTVCLDCDEQGRAAAGTRVKELAEAGVEARLVDLFPGRDDGYDIGDALMGAVQEGRVDDLRRYLVRLEDGAWRQAA